jgi:hypothetical protein
LQLHNNGSNDRIEPSSKIGSEFIVDFQSFMKRSLMDPPVSLVQLYPQSCDIAVSSETKLAENAFDLLAMAKLWLKLVAGALNRGIIKAHLFEHAPRVAAHRFLLIRIGCFGRKWHSEYRPDQRIELAQGVPGKGARHYERQVPGTQTAKIDITIGDSRAKKLTKPPTCIGLLFAQTKRIACI